MKDTNNEITYGIRACNECDYYLRCEECVYNGENVKEMIADAKISILKRLLQEKSKYSSDYCDYIVEKSDIEILIDELSRGYK